MISVESKPKISNPLPKDWKQRRKRVLVRDSGLCTIHGPRCQREASEIDHIIPREEGGGHELWNLRAVCVECHKDRRRHRLCSTRWW